MPSMTRKLKEKRKHLNPAAFSSTTMPKTEQSRQLSTVYFDAHYTQNAQGFYIRNTNPSSEPLSAERIADNLRHLLAEAGKTDTVE